MEGPQPVCVNGLLLAHSLLLVAFRLVPENLSCFTHRSGHCRHDALLICRAPTRLRLHQGLLHVVSCGIKRSVITENGASIDTMEVSKLKLWDRPANTSHIVSVACVTACSLVSFTSSDDHSREECLCACRFHVLHDPSM